MQIQVKKLRENLALLGAVVPKKPHLPILTNVLLRDGRAVATDLEVALSLEFPEARGIYLIPHKDVLDYLRFVPGDTLAKLSQDGDTLTISCGASHSTFPGASLDDYPPQTFELEGAQELYLDGDRLVEALQMALDYAAKDDSRPVLRGVTLVLEEGSAWAAAGDGYRMFYKEIPCKDGTVMTTIIPTKAVEALGQLWKQQAKTGVNPTVDTLLVELAIAKRLISLAFTQERMVARFGQVTLAVNLIQGIPPQWKPLIPRESTHRVKFLAEDLYRVARQVQGIAADGNGILRLSWAAGEMTVTARGGTQTAEVKIPAVCEDEGGRIAFNIKYILEYLKGNERLVELGVSTPTAPGCFLDGRSAVVIMPMSVQDEASKEAEDKAPEPAAESEPAATEPSAEEESGEVVDPDPGETAVTDEQEDENLAKEREAEAQTEEQVRKCRVCGCTEENACQTPEGPCHWVEEDLCSNCESQAPVA